MLTYLHITTHSICTKFKRILLKLCLYTPIMLSIHYLCVYYRRRRMVWFFSFYFLNSKVEIVQHNTHTDSIFFQEESRNIFFLLLLLCQPETMKMFYFYLQYAYCFRYPMVRSPVLKRENNFLLKTEL